MRLIDEFGFCVTVGMEEEHQQWLEANEQAIADACPEGVRYMGTFVTVYSTEKQAGQYKQYFELDSYGAKDRMAAASRDASGDCGRLLREGTRLWDTDRSAPWSNGLYKSAVDGSIFDPPSG